MPTPFVASLPMATCSDGDAVAAVKLDGGICARVGAVGSGVCEGGLVTGAMISRDLAVFLGVYKVFFGKKNWVVEAQRRSQEETVFWG
ncbi:hypothetical protein ABZP36_026698 [Zizania latifolia]